MVFASLFIAVAAYLLGSIPIGYLLVRIFRHQDIRQAGSGNIGATNVLRSGGKVLGAATFLLDVLKGCSAVWLGALLGGLLAALAAITLFALILLISRYVSVASILSAASFPVFAWLFNRVQGGGDRPPLLIAVEIAVVLIIIAKHHQNIRRLLDGTESRFGAHSGVRKTA